MPGRSLSRALLPGIALAVFAAYTWRAPLMFFSGDDMMNMYKAWRTPAAELMRTLWAFWVPAYRPLGGAVYRLFYGLFGFHPGPLYAFCWALLIANAALLYIVAARISGTRFHPLLTCVVATIHGMYLDLYYSAGTIYDRLAALFCLLAVLLWLKARKEGWPLMTLTFTIAALTIAGCDSKENAIAIPVLLLATEVLIVRAAGPLRGRIRALIPFAISVLIVVTFFAFRIRGTSDLSANPAYQAHFGLRILLSDLSVYLGYVTYGALSGAGAVMAVLCAMVAITAWLRSRLMLFGFVWFAATILPVSVIEARLGYVLYLPMMGFAIWLFDAIYRVLQTFRTPARVMPACAVTLAALVCLWNALHWPRNWVPQETPEWVTTRQFLNRYPRLGKGSKLLFISDPFPRRAFDLLFNLRLLYHDDSLIADRLLSGMPDQRPRPGFKRSDYDHVFTFTGAVFDRGCYVEYAPEWNIPGEMNGN